MMPLEKKLSFAFSGTALVLLAMALWQAYAPYVERLEDVRSIRGSITLMTPGELAEKIKNKPPVPTLLYIYASWCSKCGQVTPHLAGVIREHEFDDVRFIFVSIDKDETVLMDYLVRTHYDGLFVPYIVRQRMGGSSLPRMMESLGGRYTGTIPYLAFFDKRGKLAQEFSGVTSRNDILAALKRVQQ